MKIKKALAEKANRGHCEIYSISPDKTLQEAAREMCTKGIGGMLVVDSNSEPVGVITERDIMRSCSEMKDFAHCKVSEVMTRDMVVARMDDDVTYVMSVMTKKHIRHIPVIDDRDGETVVTGFLSIRDLLYAVIDEKDIRIQHLKDFSATHRCNVY